MKRLRGLACFVLALQFFGLIARADGVSPAAVGWGNVFVPGLGATLRGESARGLLEAGSELGLYYGGTIGNREGTFTIDGSIEVPHATGIGAPLLGQFMQEFGLKLHMYDTFYNYQQAALGVADSEREKNSPQPLYRGNWADMLGAPFQWKNLSSPWVYPLILVSSAYLLFDYSSSSVRNQGFSTTPAESAFYGFNQIGAIPLGGALGEEAFFRGFVQREARLYSHSLTFSLLSQSTLFTLLHPNDLKLTAFLSGIYFGLLTNASEGNIEPAIAAHFWVNVVNGLTSLWLFQRTQGKDTPLAPPLTAQIKIPF